MLPLLVHVRCFRLFVCLFAGPVPATVTTLSQAASLWPLPARVATYWNAPPSAHRRWVGTSQATNNAVTNLTY